MTFLKEELKLNKEQEAIRLKRKVGEDYCHEIIIKQLIDGRLHRSMKGTETRTRICNIMFEGIGKKGESAG